MRQVLSLLPSATEIIYALGAEEQLVGVTHECDFPTAARAKPQVTSARISPAMASEEIDRLVRSQLDESGSLYRLELDLVRELGPDLVLTQQLCTVCAVGFETVRAAMQTLVSPPLVHNLEPTTLADVFDAFTTVAGQLGLMERGEALVADQRRRLDAIPSLSNPPQLLFLEWLLPPFSAGHWIPELIEAAGAIPVLDSRGGYSKELTTETIMASDFDVLAISCCGFGIARTLGDVERSELIAVLRRERPTLRIIVFDGNHFFSRPGPRLVEGAELLHYALVGRRGDEVEASIPEPYLELT